MNAPSQKIHSADSETSNVTSSRGSRASNGWARWVALGDTHCPFQNDKLMSRAYDLVRDYQPDVVVFLGDLLEADAASQWGNESNHTMDDEIDAAREIVSSLMDSGGPNCQYVFCEGNHDNNIRRKGRLDRKIRSLLDYRKHIPELAGWTWIPYEFHSSQVFRLGQVTFAHGWKTDTKGSAKEAATLGVPYGLYVRGHSHRPRHPEQVWLSTDTPLPYWRANPGTLGPLNPPYMERKSTHLWGSGVLTGASKVGRSHYSKPQWEAQLHVLQVDQPSVWLVGRSSLSQPT